MGWLPLGQAPIFDPATTAWVNAVISAGGTVSGTQQTQVDILIKALKTASVFTMWDALWLMDADNLQQTQISIATGNAAWTVQSGSISLVAAGTKSNVSGVINTGINLSTATNFQRTSGSLLAYVTAADTAALGCSLGANNGTVGSAIFNTGSGTNDTAGINIQSGDGSVGGSASVKHLIIGTRTAAGIGGDNVYYWNSGSPATGGASGDTDLARPNLNPYMLAINGGGPAFNPWGGTLGVSGIGSGVNLTQATAIATALNAYENVRGNNAW